MRLPAEKVSVGACLEEQQRQFLVVLLPCHQPVRLNVALPLPFVVALQWVGVVCGGQLARLGQQTHSIKNEVHVIATLLTSLQLLVETLGGLNPELHRAMPSF